MMVGLGENDFRIKLAFCGLTKRIFERQVPEAQCQLPFTQFTTKSSRSGEDADSSFFCA
jgi:hypothetical protein